MFIIKFAEHMREKCLNWLGYQTDNGTLWLVRLLFGFNMPGNDRMFSIITLYVEMMSILFGVAFIIIFLIAIIIDLFKADKNYFTDLKIEGPYIRPVIHFTSKQEALLDAAFAVFPTIIIVYLIIPSLSFIFQLEYDEDMLETTFKVNIIGHQWYWSYELDVELATDVIMTYYDNSYDFRHIAFDSYMVKEGSMNRLLETDKYLVLPAWHNISFVITSEDVIHSWAVPQLGIKIDAIPGRMMNFILPGTVPGTYFGQCSELCGVNHAFMPIVIQFVSEKHFLDWVLLYSDKHLVQEMSSIFDKEIDNFHKYNKVRNKK